MIPQLQNGCAQLPHTYTPGSFQKPSRKIMDPRVDIHFHDCFRKKSLTDQDRRSRTHPITGKNKESHDHGNGI